MSHTPGPWRVDPKRELRVCTASDDVTVATTGCDEQQRDQWEANARLIAAAPLMLSTLKLAEEILKRIYPQGGGDLVLGSGLISGIRAAIAKAEGK